MLSILSKKIWVLLEQKNRNLVNNKDGNKLEAVFYYRNSQKNKKHIMYTFNYTEKHGVGL
jgi:hypothetical protein